MTELTNAERLRMWEISQRDRLHIVEVRLFDQESKAVATVYQLINCAATPGVAVRDAIDLVSSGDLHIWEGKEFLHTVDDIIGLITTEHEIVKVNIQQEKRRGVNEPLKHYIKSVLILDLEPKGV
ncbi:hypothetical protein CIG75_12865 [Tumebacillus algifaecis]|uniref:Uncharacterized protein n=1 Tax=Tumebacillus algifaecis TaxID=1214604 RepID=A0A223D2H5_9BACL|nr:hypothetical protein [Tumebacillus algifaecis]ASS75790.1 hypothetical protein CIG75_12865 [Tumebacillus algifaecis]